AAPEAEGFRPDIEGLRAVAVLLVVLGHAGVPFVSGGFVGVDVFFVISGFLITSLLLRQRPISFARFYARRMLRLLPAATVVLLTTLAAAWLWLTPVRFTEYAWDAVASSTWWVNLRLAITGTDYFATGPPSPFQHFWSLAVEEQFYLVWPLLIVLFRRRLVAVLGGLIAVSFAAGVLELQRAGSWAYFGPHTRAWELGIGALLAVVPLRRAPRWLSFAGLAAIAVAAVVFDDGTPFPGYAALLPVLGTAAVIAARDTTSILSVRPAQEIGRLSYSLYLWHWPVLVIAGAGHGLAVKLALCVGALGLAWLTYRFVENPVRHLRALRVHPARGLALGLVLATTAATISLVAVRHPPSVSAGGPAAAPVSARLHDLLAAAGKPEPLPSNLTPALAAAKDDLNKTYKNGCHLAADQTETKPCVFGDVSATKSVVLFGDSHAAQWFPAFEASAARNGWRLMSWTRSGCSPAGIDLVAGNLKRPYPQCTTWRGETIKRIRALAPDVVVVTGKTNYRSLLDGSPADPDAAWRDGWGETLSSLRGAAKQVVVLGDTTNLPSSPTECLAAHPDDVSDCAVPVADALDGPGWRAAVRQAASANGARFVDPVPWLCATRCPVVLGNLLVYRDDNHISTAYTEFLASRLAAATGLS
ncbi:acyltransferase family protein, partial [Actinoplanes sp. NPDC051633]|uniref:acyltransferase family protein n=1 Tax=Actinoplanes sp. NPDC051633 TaxID=3155670 RepID=UPI00342682E6